MKDYVLICGYFLATAVVLVVVFFIIDTITSSMSKYVYDKLNTDTNILIDENEDLRNLLDEEIEKNNSLITENRRLETEKYKLVEELNKRS